MLYLQAWLPLPRLFLQPCAPRKPLLCSPPGSKTGAWRGEKGAGAGLNESHGFPAGIAILSSSGCAKAFAEPALAAAPWDNGAIVSSTAQLFWQPAPSQPGMRARRRAARPGGGLAFGAVVWGIFLLLHWEMFVARGSAQVWAAALPAGSQCCAELGICDLGVTVASWRAVKCPGAGGGRCSFAAWLQHELSWEGGGEEENDGWRGNGGGGRTSLVRGHPGGRRDLALTLGECLEEKKGVGSVCGGAEPPAPWVRGACAHSGGRVGSCPLPLHCVAVG